MMLLAAVVTFGQARQFEVASVRPAAPVDFGGGGGRGGGPGVGGGNSCGIPMLSMDGGRVKFACIPVSGLIVYAYGVRPDQITGPDWLTDPGAQRFDVVAKLPAGATEAQVPEMFQALLAERFKLTLHRGTKEQAGYSLVTDKGGLKLKAAAPDAVAAPPGDTDPALCPPRNFNCAPQMRNFGGVLTRITPVTGQVRKISNARIGVATVTSNVLTGKTTIEIPSTTLEGLADVVTAQIGSPVVDATGIKGRYEALLEASLNMDRSGDPLTPDAAADRILTAYQNALQKIGLRLEPRKAAVETIIVDRGEETPTEN
jgi:uncharacterized protein (TIGR03435 family)